MSQQVQELIDKIKSEGIDAANKKARDIEEDAKRKSQQALQDAKRQADQMIVDAKQDIKKMQETAQMALKQSCRDALLSLKKDIQQMLSKIMNAHVGEALSLEQLTGIIESVIKHAVDGKSGGDVVVSLSAHDLDKLKKGALAKLQGHFKTPVRFQASGDISKGFVVSFDGGKSGFDFSDASLAEYLTAFVNQEIAGLLKDAAK